MRNDNSFAGPRPFRALRAAALALTAAFAFAAPVAAEPSFNDPGTLIAPPGVRAGVLPSQVLENAGTNAQFTEAEFSTTQYYSESGILSGILAVKAKTSADLRALASPPPNPFTVTVDVTLTNDEGQTAEGTLTFETAWNDGSGLTPQQPGVPPEPPVFSATEPAEAPPGLTAYIAPDQIFDNAGEGSRITEAEFSTTEYYNIHEIRQGILVLQPKTAEELNALPTPPPSPFTVTVDVTMEDIVGQTASGTLTLETSYDRTEEPDETETTPSFSQTGPLTAEPGVTATFSVGDFFSDTGTNPRFEGWGSPDTQYLSRSGTGLPFEGAADTLKVTVLTESELNALASPPPATFTFTVEVTMTNDEGQYASGTLTFQTTYMRVDDGTPAPISGGEG